MRRKDCEQSPDEPKKETWGDLVVRLKAMPEDERIQALDTLSFIWVDDYNTWLCLAGMVTEGHMPTRTEYEENCRKQLRKALGPDCYLGIYLSSTVPSHIDKCDAGLKLAP